MVKFPITLVSLVLGTPLVLADSGKFNLLSLNVAGLPQILQDNGETLNKDEATTQIGKAFTKLQKELDVIHIQEDFHYHDILYENDNHPYRTSSSGDIPFGSGLNSLSNFPYINYQRKRWDTCSDASEFDCWTPKGFTAMKIPFDGAIVNFINLHTDAGTEGEDEDARNDNLQQVADFIDGFCPDEAVILFGDTNSRYTRSLDNIEVFDEQNGLANPWIDITRNGDVPAKGADPLMCSLPATNNTCETVDKLFYRGSKTIELNSTSFRYADDLFVYDDNQLSDHNPILINFTYTVSEDFKTSNLSGGYYGSYFNDISKINVGVKPTKISFKGDNRLDSVGVTLNDGTVLYHGGNGGETKELKLKDDEYWIESYLCTGQRNNQDRIFYINATTSDGNVLEAGTETEDCELFEAPEGFQISGYFGQSADEIDLLGLIYIKQ